LKTAKEYIDDIAKEKDKLIRQGKFTSEALAKLYESTLRGAMQDVETYTIERCAKKMGTSEILGSEVK